MADPLTPAAQMTPDVLMRRLVHLLARLDTVCAQDAEELRGQRAKRQEDISTAERTTRMRTEQAVTSAPDLTEGKSLGGRLRAELAELIDVQHGDPGRAPSVFDDAIAEWMRLAPSTQRRVREYRTEREAWQQRLIKRSKSAPQVDADLWRDLDRLDLIHRAMAALTQSVIAQEVQAVTAAADVVLEAEAQRQQAAQAHLAAELRDVLSEVERQLTLPAAKWSDLRWDSPSAAATVQPLVRIGELVADLPSSLGVQGVPALLEFPLKAGVAVRASVDGRSEAFAFLKSLMLRLLASVPPGALQLKVIDPVALGQSVAEFRHLAEYDEQLVDEKTWTSERDIERLLDGLTDHIEVVISQYLKGQFETIDDYNKHAGEVAQPYRVLVVFDFPNGFSERAARQLLSLSENGPRCGVYTVLHYADDGARVEPSGDRIARDMQRITLSDGGWQLELPDPVGKVDLQLFPDQAPSVEFDEDGRPETGAARLLTAIGEVAKAGHERPTAVTLGSLLPVLARTRTGVTPDFEHPDAALGVDPASWWRASTAKSAVALLGRSGAQQVAAMHFSSTDIAGGAIMVGLPRSGKTTSLHALITTMAMLYSPDELELYLIDAKHGVEFKAYENLPHARMVSIHSDREFSLAILKALDDEIRRRAELMKAEGSGRANITEYRTATGDRLARIVLVMDEFHELFEEPDRVGQEAFASFSNIVRMGPFSGVHVVVASQTLSSMPAMDRPTLMLLPQRVAFMCTEYDAEVVMGATNTAPLRLSKTGEGVFNAARGEESRNQLFQGLHIPADERSAILSELESKAEATGWTRVPRVFDGDAVVSRPPRLSPQQRDGKRFVFAVGEPFSLADTERATLRRSRGSNLLLVGSEASNQDLALRGVLHSCLVAANEQETPTTVIDYAGEEDDEIDGISLVDVADAVGARFVRSRGSGAQLAEVAARVAERIAADDYKAESEILIIVGLERARSLEPVDPYAFDASAPSESAHILSILEGGPEVGVHVVIQCDRVKTIEARLGAAALSELALRIGTSGADHADLSTVAGQYGDVPALRNGQLLIGDITRGTARRVRGFSALRRGDIANAHPGGVE